MDKFEYLVTKITYYQNGLEAHIQKELNKLGEEGWELVTLKGDDIFILKRKKKSDYDIQNGNEQQ